MSGVRLSAPYDAEDWRTLALVVRRADHCHGIVTREGEMDACGKPPVAIIDGRSSEDETFWPACSFHAHRYGRGRCVPLSVIVTAVGGWAQ